MTVTKLNNNAAREGQGQAEPKKKDQAEQVCSQGRRRTEESRAEHEHDVGRAEPESNLRNMADLNKLRTKLNK